MREGRRLGGPVENYKEYVHQEGTGHVSPLLCQV